MLASGFPIYLSVCTEFAEGSKPQKMIQIAIGNANPAQGLPGVAGFKIF